MANKIQHIRFGIVIGGIAGVLLAILLQMKNEKAIIRKMLGYGIVGSICGYFGSILPDKIEPATHPNHRGFAHSITVGCLLVLFLGLSFKNQNKELVAIIVQTFEYGYLSHFYLDSRTIRGLPLIT